MISRAHKTIFLHIPKAAGQSIEMAFLRDLGLDWSTREQVLLRPNDDPAAGPERLAHLFAREYVSLAGTSSPSNFRPSSSSRSFEIQSTGRSRNSNYRRVGGSATIRDNFSKTAADTYSDEWRHICPQHLFITGDEGENLLVDEIVKLEELGSQWGHISKRVFGEERVLVKRNQSKPGITAATISKEDLDYIAETYAKDFSLLGYAVST